MIRMRIKIGLVALALVSGATETPGLVSVSRKKELSCK